MPITASGIGSGLDVASLVSQLVAAESEPANARLNAKEVSLGSELSAYGTLKSALSTFQTSVKKLETASAFQVFTASSSNKSVFTASTDTTASSGSYDIEVLQLAKAAKVRSTDFTASTEVIGTGTLDISLGASTFQLIIDSGNNTLKGIRDAINSAADNPGVTASLITVDSGTQLILSSNQLGASNTIGIAATDDAAGDGFDLARLASANMLTLQSATDAVIKVDTQTVTRDSNNFSDVISGVSFNLTAAQPGITEKLTIAADNESIKKDVKSFVTNYNVLIGVMKGLSKYDATTKLAGALNGDSVIRGIQSKLRQAFSTTVNSGGFSNLSELGIKLSEGGSYVLDDATFDSKLANNLSDIQTFFSATDGMVKNFTSALSGYLDTDGIIDNRSDGLQSRLDSIGDKRDSLVRRMATYEARLNLQFGAMDRLVSQLQATGNYLTQQLASLASISSN